MRSALWLPRSSGARILGAALAMIGVAAIAVWILSPDAFADPELVAEGELLGAAELERARDYRGPQRWLLLGGIAIELALLLALTLRPPAWIRRGATGFRRPVLGAAVAGVAVAIALELATLPLGLVAHERAVDVGLSSQSLGSWLWDFARSAAIAAALTALGAALLIALVRRFPRRWWLPGGLAAAVLAAVFVWIAPVALAPIFNDFEPLPAGSRARADVLELGRAAEVEIGEVYRVDASRRITSLNAYVDGLGSTKRVVLYDNLLDRAGRRELNSVVAHELGHVAHRDLPRGIAFIALVAPLGLLFTRELATALTRRAEVDPASPAAVPAYVLGLTLAILILSVVGNQLSRQVEASADRFALELTDDPRAFIDVQLRLARANLSDPDPPDVFTTLFATHPPTTERVGAARAYEPKLSETNRP